MSGNGPSCGGGASAEERTRAWVVFSGEAELAWLRLLRPGFRHCFVALNDGRHWITIDPLSPFTDVAVPSVPADFDLPDWFRRQGMTVVPGGLRRGLTRPAPWAPFTCVEAVKRVLGIQDRFVLTPWQLYRHLTRAVPAPDGHGAFPCPERP